jgi:hypothetical protein
MSKEENTDIWEEEAKARLSGINDIAKKADSVATRQLRQQVSKLVRAKAEPEHNPVSELPGKLIDRLVKESLRSSDNEFLRGVGEEYSKIRAKTELQETQQKNDAEALLEVVSKMNAKQLYQIAEDLYQGKAIAEIRNKYTPILRGTWINL